VHEKYRIEENVEKSTTFGYNGYVRVNVITYSIYSIRKGHQLFGKPFQGSSAITVRKLGRPFLVCMENANVS